MKYTITINGKQQTVTFNTSLLALLNYRNYFGSDCLADLEAANDNKEYVNLFQCVAGCYKSEQYGLSSEAIDEFLANDQYLNKLCMNDDFIDKFINALLGKQTKGNKKQSGKNQSRGRQKS